MSTVRVRFAPSPTGSLHLGNALTAVANRRFADERNGALVLRIDDTDAAREVESGEAGILGDLAWLGVRFDEGPLRQSERGELYRAAAERLLSTGAATQENDGTVRLVARSGAGGAATVGAHRPTLLRGDGTATYHLASVVDDSDLHITHVIRGADHRPNAELHLALFAALGVSPPELLHHGLILGEDGQKLSKRAGVLASIADLRDAGIPPEAVRAYLEELGLPRHDVQLDLTRIRRLAVEAIAVLSDEELVARAGAPLRLAAALRGARDLAEARDYAQSILRPDLAAPLPAEAAVTLARFAELRSAAGEELDDATAHAIVRELKAVGGSLKALRLALTGRERGPELWAVLRALTQDEALARVGFGVAEPR
jgi:glutamyl-tRNA synthetase